jgi:hypothetical protein
MHFIKRCLSFSVRAGLSCPQLVHHTHGVSGYRYSGKPRSPAGEAIAVAVLEDVADGGPGPPAARREWRRERGSRRAARRPEDRPGLRLDLCANRLLQRVTCALLVGSLVRATQWPRGRRFFARHYIYAFPATNEITNVLYIVID